jgi:hypothetical protein
MRTESSNNALSRFVASLSPRHDANAQPNFDALKDSDKTSPSMRSGRGVVPRSVAKELFRNETPATKTKFENRQDSTDKPIRFGRGFVPRSVAKEWNDTKPPTTKTTLENSAASPNQASAKIAGFSTIIRNFNMQDIKSSLRSIGKQILFRTNTEKEGHYRFNPFPDQGHHGDDSSLLRPKTSSQSELSKVD